jgi:hypothetical protein
MRRLMISAVVLIPLASPAPATTVTRESDLTGIRLGQRLYVDDATCPTGQIKEITGKTLTAKGIISSKKCVPRKSERPN